ncbi:DUF2293 domain-containing protein [Chloroflexi bacterium TSY]|nr:DUF2293 domain-containing protein [Chloroflexi bacterium TSY]
MTTKKTDDLKVFISRRDSVCGECERELGRSAWITLDREKGALCLDCADLDHLVFLASGDAALTRRSKKHSRLWAVVLKWSRTRKRYERQGLLVEEAALDQAEEECLADAEVRERRRQRNAIRREELDRQYVERFAGEIQSLFPHCPSGRAQSIAEHACLKYSGRVGRSAAAKQLDSDMVRLAVSAHIRHVETDYDELLMAGYDRYDARSQVSDQIADVLADWQGR